MEELLKLAIKASLKAGKEILHIYHSDFDIETKDDDSPLTTADKNSNTTIMEFLNTSDIPVLSEEGRNIPYSERKNWKQFWLIDPLDGTREFIRKNDEFTVNIALIEDQSPVMGVIYVPVLDLLYFASGETGSYMLENAFNNCETDFNLSHLVSSGQKLPINTERITYTVVASRSHMSTETEEYINKLRKEHQSIDLISRGSSLKICMVAEGKADVYPRFAPTSEWDTAAGQAIAIFSGARLTKVDEKEMLKYNKRDLLNPWFIVKR
ncbi:MAG: 3'(2'),5'-bisphosphate nucleotidase CysQ [Bacteroidota bacterium]|nr:3'(2'),5'-bisphosphate nucleotidase CysQ [Bacteroidota bacterium]